MSALLSGLFDALGHSTINAELMQLTAYQRDKIKTNLDKFEKYVDAWYATRAIGTELYEGRASAAIRGNAGGVLSFVMTVHVHSAATIVNKFGCYVPLTTPMPASFDNLDFVRERPKTCAEEGACICLWSECPMKTKK